jgi:Putative Flp pilus-assembly TadE/G-like
MKLFKAQLMRRVATGFKAFSKDTAGAVAMTFALSSLPIFAAAGVALDYNRTLDARVMLQDLADRAALAGAANKGSSDDQKATALAFIAQNDTELYGLSYTPNVDVGDDTVTVTITGEVQGTLTSIFSATHQSAGLEGGGNGGSGGMGINLKSVAQFVDSDGQAVCMLATEQVADDALYLHGTGNLNAVDCGVHSDSSSPTQALHLQGSSMAYADFFSTVGGWAQTGGGQGSLYSVEPESGQSVVGDPFDKTVTCPNTTGSAATFNGTLASPTSLSQETYTNLSGANGGGGGVKYGMLTPGTHYIKGTISLSNNKVLKGVGVTLVLCGPNAKIDMQGGGLEISAPTTGEHAGFAVIGDSTATAQNSLNGGAQTTIKGIWYTPKSKLNIAGNGGFNVNSAYFPIVSKQTEVAGSGTINIGMDYDAYDYDKPEELWINQGREVALIE